MKKVLILEDNDLTRNRLVKIIKDIDDEIGVFAFANIEDAFGCALTHRIDLFMVDIILYPKERNDFSGIDFVERIRECPSCASAEVIFITSLAGLEAELMHRVHCYDYIEKPIDDKHVEKIVVEILNRGEKASRIPERMYFRNDGIIYPMDVDCIKYVIHQNRKLYVYGEGECIEVPNLSLKHFLEQVKDSVFLMPMKGTAVNIAYIESVDYIDQFIHIKGEKNPVCMGSVMKKKFRKEYEEYVKRGFG